MEAEYIRITGKWINKLTEKVEEWRNKWEKITATDFPKLFFLEGNDTPAVLDKRNDPGKKIDLNFIETTILKVLERRKSISWLQTQFKNSTSNPGGMRLAPAIKKAHAGQPQFAEQRTIHNRIMMAFASALFAAIGAMGLLLQILGNLLLDNGLLHRFKQIRSPKSFNRMESGSLLNQMPPIRAMP